MSSNLLNEQLMGLAQAARRIPSGRRDRPVNPSTLFRWVHDGVKLPTGSVVRLEAVRMGGRWLTSLEALQRFAEAQTPRLDGQAEAPALRTPAARRRASERAAAELDKAGIC
jgi:hypothetical protein